MRLATLDGDVEVDTLEELRRYTSQRHHGKYGAFWLSENKWPAMAIMVNGGDGFAHYFPNENDPGFQPVPRNEDWENVTVFLAENGEETEVSRALVWPTATVLEAFEEFFVTRRMPSCLTWEEL